MSGSARSPQGVPGGGRTRGAGAGRSGKSAWGLLSTMRRRPPAPLMIWSRTLGAGAWLEPGSRRWLLLSFRYGEGAGDARARAALHRIAVGAARRAAPVDRRAPVVQVDDPAPA